MKTLSQFLNTNPPNQESIIARSPSLRWFIYSNVTVFCRCGTSSRCTQPQVVRMRYVPCVSLGRQVQFFLDVYIVAGFVMSWKWLVNALFKNKKKPPVTWYGHGVCKKTYWVAYGWSSPDSPRAHGNVFYREPFESHYKAIREPCQGHQKALARREALERHQRAIREPWESHET